MLDKFKEHVQEHKVLYSCIGTGITVAGITYAIMRGRSLQHLRCAIGVPSQGAIGVLGEVVTNTSSKTLIGSNKVLNNVSYFAADRKGPPSWVIRCIETGNVFTSQNAAAIAMDLPASKISEHLNGVIDHVKGFTFERLCMAA